MNLSQLRLLKSKLPLLSSNNHHSNLNKKGMVIWLGLRRHIEVVWENCKNAKTSATNGPGRRQTPTPPGKPEGWNRLCFWCRDFASFDDANHPIKQCPYYKEVRKDWWQNSKHLLLNLLLMLLKTHPLRETSKESIWGWQWHSFKPTIQFWKKHLYEWWWMVSWIER